MAQEIVAQPSNSTVISSTIEIGTVEALFGICALVLAMGIAWGSLKKSVDKIEETLKEDIKPEVKKISALEVRVDTIWKDNFAPASSPRKLNDRGKDILKESGIKDILDEKRAILLQKIKEQPITTAYDAERQIEKNVHELPAICPDVVTRLKDGAFKTGTDIDAVLFVGSIYFRDAIFDELGFHLNDLDT